MKVFVGNIPFSFGEEELEKLFSGFGPIMHSLVVRYKSSGRSKGYGFVVLESESDASEAISQLNSSEVEGRVLQVEMASSQDISEFKEVVNA